MCIRDRVWPPSSPNAREPSSRRSNRKPRSSSSSSRAGASSHSTRTVSGAHRPRPAARVSAACWAGESPGSSAAARPPWAWKLALSTSGLREIRQVRAPASAAQSAVHIPAAPPPTTATSKLLVSVESRDTAAVTVLPVGLYFRHDLSLEHETGAHPENAERICAIERRMRAENFHGLEVREAPAAPEAAVEAVHPGGYRAEIERLADAGGGAIDADTVLSPRSYEAAMHAAGAAFEAVDRALGDGVGFSFCALRPPGHHAEPDRPMGFCLFNNVAIGATHALDAHGAERVLILDWDVHHGNGTQAVFYDSSAVLLIAVSYTHLR